MNFINALQRKFGSKETKINAIYYDNEKLADAINYLTEKLAITDEPNTREYIIQKINDLKYIVDDNHTELEGLKR